MKQILIYLLVLVAIIPQRAKAQVVINELMASNGGTITDPDYGESADWVELFNMGSKEIDLSGYFVSDNPNSPDKYALPSGTIIAPGGYLLLWCDGNSKGLHTSFKLSADGESVCLYTPDGDVVDLVDFDVQFLDVSYGRSKDTTDEWTYFPVPTPGEANSHEGYTGKANVPMILTRGGLYSGCVTVSITNDLGGRVHYTTDGSVPTQSSPVYEQPLTFTTTTVLRVRIIEDGKMPGTVVTESYFVDEAFAGHELPVVSIVTDAANFWDKDKGIYMQSFKPDWEVPVNIEMFLNNGSDRSVFNEAAGIKINGLYAWQLPQKMLGVYFKKKYGESKLAYQLFVDDNRSSFDDFALRASGSDWSYTLMRDGLVQQAARRGGMNLDLMAFRPCVVYVNGEFLGIHNIREKVNKDYIKRHYDYGSGTFDMVEGGDTPEEGTTAAWNAFFKKAKSANLADNATFQSLADEMDVENFTDYIISQSYCANTSLDHNTMVWKPLDGGKWRWILMDTDRGFFNFDESNLNYVVKRDYWPLKQMFNNEDYKSYFLRRMADQLFTTFNAEEVRRQIDQHEADIAPVINRHVARWLGTTSSYGDAMPSVSYWRDQVELLRDFAYGRVPVLLDDMCNYGAGKSAVLSLSSQPSDACTLTFNGHDLPRTNWTGLYPRQMDVKLTARQRAGYAFRGWKQTILTDLVPRTSTWTYLDNGVDQGKSWREPAFDDSSWKTGEGLFGYGFDGAKTQLGYDSSGKKYYTYYFRRHFTVDDKTAVRGLKLRLCREDGAVVYINGKQVLTSNMPLEGLSYKTKALKAMYTAALTTYLLYDISPEYLVDGDNVIAVEVHQISSTSSDLSFDLQLQAETIDPASSLLSSAAELNMQLSGDTGICAMYEPTGESILPDTIRGDMVLRKALSPYLASSDVVVSADARLTIEPGVTLLFSPGANMIVHGAVMAEGTPEDSIMFRLNPAYDPSLSWGAMCFINTADRVSSISYAEFRDGSRGPQEYNCVAVVSGFGTTLRLDHLRITDTDANPVAVRYSDLRLTNSVLHSHITGDLANVKYGKGYIADCEFIGNDQEDTDGIDYDGVTGGVIKRVVIHDFLGDNSDAIDIGEQADRVLVDSVLVYNITDKGFSLGQRSTARVSNSTFIQTNLGLGVKDSCYVDVDHCTFYAVRTPLASYEKVLGRAGGNVNVRASIFANSLESDALCDAKSRLIVNGSLSDSYELPYGVDNILADPQFLAPSLYDLRSDLPLVADIGAKYMPQYPLPQPVFTELRYMADAQRGETEYVMISNPSHTDIDLSGYTFTQGITFTFPEGLVLPASGSLYVVRTAESLDTNMPQLQWESGKLADEGETLELSTPAGIVVDQVSYKPETPWPVVVAGGENVIMLTEWVKANHIASNWQLRQPVSIADAVAVDRHSRVAYDLLGRPVNPETARGIFIIGGKKIVKRSPSTTLPL